VYLPQAHSGNDEPGRGFGASTRKLLVEGRVVEVGQWRGPGMACSEVCVYLPEAHLDDDEPVQRYCLEQFGRSAVEVTQQDLCGDMVYALRDHRYGSGRGESDDSVVRGLDEIAGQGSTRKLLVEGTEGSEVDHGLGVAYRLHDHWHGVWDRR
jgi:hypothetical protein